VVSTCLPSFPPAARSARRRLPCRGSRGPRFPTVSAGAPSPRPSVLCSAPTATCPFRVASPVARFPSPLPAASLRVPWSARRWAEATCLRQGSWSAGYPSSSGMLCPETAGSPTFPRDPCDGRPRAQPPVVSWTLARAPPELLPSARCPASALASRVPPAVLLLSPTLPISGLHPAACHLAPPRSAPPLLAEPVGFAPDLLAGPESGGT